MNSIEAHPKRKSRNSSENVNFRNKRPSNNNDKRGNTGRQGHLRKKFKNYFARESKRLYTTPELLSKQSADSEIFPEIEAFITQFPQCFTTDAIPPSNTVLKHSNPSKGVIVSYSRREQGRMVHKENDKEKIPDWYDPGKDSKVVMNGNFEI